MTSIQSIKVSAAVNVTYTTSSTAGSNVSSTLYTVPANSYAILTVSCNGGANSTTAVARIGDGATAYDQLFGCPASNAGAVGSAQIVIYMGPGQTLQLGKISSSASGTAIVTAAGVCLTNS